MTQDKQFGRRAVVAAAIMGSWLAAGAAQAADTDDGTHTNTAPGATYQDSDAHDSSSMSGRDHASGNDQSTGLTGGETTGERDDKTAAQMTGADGMRNVPAQGATGGAAAQGTMNMDDTDIETANEDPKDAVDTTHADEMGSGATGRAGPGYEGTSGGTGSGGLSGSGAAGGAAAGNR